MNKLNDKAIAEAAYYNLEKQRLPRHTHAQDWAAAIKQLSAAAKPTPRKTAANVSAISKISTADINALNRLAAAKGKKSARSAPPASCWPLISPPPPTPH